MEQEPVEKKILEQCMKEGLPLPKRIAEAPELELGLSFYYNAWVYLSPDRPLGFGEGPIPSASLHAYCQYMQMEGEEADDFIYLVRAIDVEYLKIKSKKNGGDGGKPK